MRMVDEEVAGAKAKAAAYEALQFDEEDNVPKTGLVALPFIVNITTPKIAITVGSKLLGHNYIVGFKLSSNYEDFLHIHRYFCSGK